MDFPEITMDNAVFRNIVEQAPDPVIILEKGLFCYLNPAACRLFRVQHQQELNGRPFITLVHPLFSHLNGEVSVLLNPAAWNEGQAIEFRIVRSDGSEAWVETTSEPFTREGNHGVLLFMRDITLRKEREKAIVENEAKYRNIFQKHVAVKLIIDAENGNIVDANEAASRFYGLPAEELKKMNISQINTLSFEDLKKAFESVRGSTERPFNFKHRTASGEIRDVEVYSSRITSPYGKDYLHSIVHDVTEKIRVEKQLTLLSRSVEQSPVSIIITDTKGFIEYVNPGFERISGYKSGEAVGKNMNLLKSGQMPDEFYRDMWKTILSGKDWSGEFLNKNKSGGLYWIQAVISPIVNDRGEVTNFVSIREDITERKKMIKDLVAAKEKAEESDRLKLAFLANMSHEIRTPMNGILGFAEILRTPGLSSSDHEKFLEIIEESGKRMLDTVNDLIDISKIETGQVKLYISEVNLREQLENLIEFFRPQADRKALQLTLKYDLPVECSLIKTDRTKLDSVLTNLIKNAIKFTDEGKIEVGCFIENGLINYYVSDTGSGIAPDRHELVFQRFVQAEKDGTRAIQGSGLGLAIARSYIEMLGGKIWLDSAEGLGSTFYFTLPCRDNSMASPERAGKKHAGRKGIPDLTGKKILIAEDDPFSREMIVFQLEKTGAILHTAGDGRATVEKFKNDFYDLVLLDIRLPEMDGYEVLKRIRKIRPQAIVIAQSAYAMAEDIRRYNKAGFTAYLTKPISREVLFSMLGKYLA
jgi:PAS domain S-box-containing protein